MRRYTYTDHSKGPVIGTYYGLAIGRPSFGRPFEKHAGEMIFECEAENILDADAALLMATGIKAEKRVDVGCSVDLEGPL